MNIWSISYFLTGLVGSRTWLGGEHESPPIAPDDILPVTQMEHKRLTAITSCIRIVFSVFLYKVQDESLKRDFIVLFLITS